MLMIPKLSAGLAPLDFPDWNGRKAKQCSRASKQVSEKFPSSAVLWFEMHTELSTLEASL